jgi:pimeloyl-ACP methyl ester carboxylesterase
MQYDLEYMPRPIVTVPIMYGPAKGRRRNEELVMRALKNILKSIWYGPVNAKNLTVEHLAKVLQPTLLLYETGSPYLKSHEILREYLVDCTSVLLPGTEIKHFSPLEQPDLLVQHIRAFLQPEGMEVSPVSGDT